MGLLWNTASIALSPVAVNATKISKQPLITTRYYPDFTGLIDRKKVSMSAPAAMRAFNASGKVQARYRQGG
jgi:hypothetical protein